MISAGVQVFPLTRHAHEWRELRRMATQWQAPGAQGSERFWSFDEVLAALSLPTRLAYFAASGVEAPWQGVLFADCGPDACDLIYVYVLPEHRQAGVARTLMHALLTNLAERPTVKAVFLEVRAGNLPAQRLYEGLGFERISARKRYYADGEDALIYKRGLAPAP